MIGNYTVNNILKPVAAVPSPEKNPLTYLIIYQAMCLATSGSTAACNSRSDVCEYDATQAACLVTANATTALTNDKLSATASFSGSVSCKFIQHNYFYPEDYCTQNFTTAATCEASVDCSWVQTGPDRAYCASDGVKSLTRLTDLPPAVQSQIPTGASCATRTVTTCMTGANITIKSVTNMLQPITLWVRVPDAKNATTLPSGLEDALVEAVRDGAGGINGSVTVIAVEPTNSSASLEARFAWFQVDQRQLFRNLLGLNNRVIDNMLKVDSKLLNASVLPQTQDSTFVYRPTSSSHAHLERPGGMGVVAVLVSLVVWGVL